MHKLFFVFLAVFRFSPVLAGTVLVSDLRCEFAHDPMGVDATAPRLSWQLESTDRGQRQTASQVLVSSDLALLSRGKGDLWNSGKVKGDSSLLVRYEGKPLKSFQQVFWKVRAWDKNGKASSWSKPRTWTMGALSESDWEARWIGASTNLATIDHLGYHSAEAFNAGETKWVQVDLGKPVRIDKVVLRPMDHRDTKGFGFPHRFKVEASNSEQFQDAYVVADHTDADFPSPGATELALSIPSVEARYVRVTATKLWKRDAKVFVFALCQLEVFSGGSNVAERRPVSAADTIENYGWAKAGLTDGNCSSAIGSKEPQTLLIRTDFKVKPGLRRAALYVCGLGCYEFSVNGRKVGDTLFPGGWTKYDKTCLYDSYDITPLVKQGENGAGILLGNGMYNVVGGRYYKFLGSFGPVKAIAMIRLEYADGSTAVIGTGPEWRMRPGPITFSCVYGGEDYDARLEPGEWTKGGFDASGWELVRTVSGPGGALRGLSCSSPPIRAFESLKPVKVTEIKPGVRVVDLGQNVSLMPRLKTRGPAGATVKIIPAELLKDDGSVDRQSCGHGAAWWQYTLKGRGWEEYFPKFFYHGSRYLQVEVASPEGSECPETEVEAVVVHADCEAVGEYECSNDLFNRIRKLVRWAQRSNMMSVLTDCPHRERLGWLEECHLNGPSMRYEFNLARLFTKAMNDMSDSQLPNGLVPDTAPEYVVFKDGFRDSPEWGSACILVPWQQYLFHGDIEMLRRYYPVMEKYVAYLGSKAANNIVSHGLGDWYDIGPEKPGVAQLTPIALTATAFYYYDAWVLAQAARLLGDAEKAKHYDALSSDIRAAFNKEFFKSDKGVYASNSQAGNAIALDMGLAEEAARDGLVEAIAKDVSDRGNALTAGDVGYRYLLRALAEGGRSDVIYAMNNQSGKPGYGYQLAKGATSLTEAWNAEARSSQNHFMLGQIMEWFYHDLAGIQPLPEKPGFKRIRIKPTVLPELTWVRASYRSDPGLICSQWEKTGGKLRLKVTVPPNSSAEVWLPVAGEKGVLESGRPVKKAKEVKFLRNESGAVVFHIDSGVYDFEAPL